MILILIITIYIPMRTNYPKIVKCQSRLLEPQPMLEIVNDL